ncbi:MAG: hypothetical protein ACI837_002100 [Crocinitomicaceae bacterium]|jgi:hypothetical protein
MKKGLFIIAAISTALTISSCGGEDTTDENNEPTPKEICFYTYDHGTSTFEWTAYKTSSKVAVKGSFNEITVTGDESSDDPIALLKSLSFSMTTATVETSDEARNKKIADSFFGAMASTEMITGKVKALGKDGKATISVTMNGNTADVVGDYTLEDGTFTFTSTVDVSLWSAMDALKSLSVVCSEKHTGDDGELKTWSEVALSFSTQLTSDCD